MLKDVRSNYGVVIETREHRRLVISLHKLMNWRRTTTSRSVKLINYENKRKLNKKEIRKSSWH